VTSRVILGMLLSVAFLVACAGAQEDVADARSLKDMKPTPSSFPEGENYPPPYSPPEDTYAIRFYVDRPTGLENHGVKFRWDFGHAVVGLATNGGCITYIGLYPVDGAAFDKTFLHNDTGQPWQESSRWYALTDAEYEVLLEHFRGYLDGRYDAIANNCADLILNTAELFGIDLGYEDGPFSVPQTLADRMQETELREAIGPGRYEIIGTEEMPDTGWRCITIENEDAAATQLVYLPIRYDADLCKELPEDLQGIVEE